MEHCVTQYQKSPSYSSLITLLISKEDATNLQKGFLSFFLHCSIDNVKYADAGHIWDLHIILGTVPGVFV